MNEITIILQGKGRLIFPSIAGKNANCRTLQTMQVQTVGLQVKKCI